MNGEKIKLALEELNQIVEQMVRAKKRGSNSIGMAENGGNYQNVLRAIKLLS